MNNHFPDLIESDFIDKVQKNLKRGRFLLLIIGDGIRENMEDLVEYIQGNAGMNFTLSLIETPLYKNPSNDEIVIRPRVLVKTKEIERTIIKLKETGEIIEQPSNIKSKHIGKSISEKDFFERLEKSVGKESSDKLDKFLEELKNEFNILTKLGRGKRLSINIKSSDDTYNFASIQETGEVWFYGIVTKTEEIGNKSIGISYLKKLAKNVSADFVDTQSEWVWGVKRNNKYLIINDYLKVKDIWKNLIADTIEALQKAEDS